MRLSLKIFIACIVVFGFSNCNTDSIYQEEQYKTLVYLLSGAENVYSTHSVPSLFYLQKLNRI